MSLRSRSLALPLTLLLTLLSAGHAAAELVPASVIDGPSATILDVDGAAMASDGTGGVVYRKLIDGQPHLFVASFQHGAWQPPVQVDTGQPFAATFPTIAAGDNGRLLVVWAEPWATIGQEVNYELMSAEMEPGSQRFGPAEQIDAKGIGNGTAAYPSLAMAPNGEAYVAYRVVTNTLVGSTLVPLRPGDELISVRVARYSGSGLPWTSLGTINAHPELTMRQPSASNAPVIGVSRLGNAVVVWQEPESAGVARIWARRLFGSRLGNVLEVSAASVNGAPITVEADAPALAVSPLGEARIAYRLAGGAGSPYGSAKILLNTLPSEVDTRGAKLLGTTVVGGARELGPPSVAIDQNGEFRLAYSGDGNAQLVTGNDFHAAAAPLALGPAAGQQTSAAINPSGGGVTAWPAVSGGHPVIDAREEFANGAWQQAQFAAPLSGPAGAPVLGGSGQGDALIAFSQGPVGQQQVMAAVAKAPPSQFQVITPVGWVKGNSAHIDWEPPDEAFGTTSYALVIDGQVRKTGISGTSLHLDSRGLGDGAHRIQILAIDSLGQETMTPVATLKVDANPPQANVKRLPHDAVQVRIHDQASGAVASATSVVFGDGAHARRKLRVRHTYAHAGRYLIVVKSRDRVGNKLDAHIWVEVP